MGKDKEKTYNNLIDYCISLEEDNSIGGDVTEMFRKLLMDYFFEPEVEESKSLAVFFENWEAPSFMKDAAHIFAIDDEQLQSFIMGETINDSLCGTVMLSKQYLKSFFPQHPPAFAQMPDEVKTELVSQIKEKNQVIIDAFEKMSQDREADKNRKMIALAALVLKNIHRRTGRPVNKMDTSVEELLRSQLPDADDVFVGRQAQLSVLNDDSMVKELIKSFFKIRQYADINEMAVLFKQEVERFRKRAIKAASD